MINDSAKSVVTNYFYNLSYQIVKMILPLITIPYVSRVLGADNLGVYSYTYSVAVYFAMIGYLGFENYGNRLIAQNRDDQAQLDEAFSGAYAFQMISGVLAIFLYIGYMLLFCRRNIMIAWIQLMYVSACLFDISWLYFGLEKFKKTANISVLVRIAAFLAVFIFVKSRDDLPEYAVICSLSFLMSTVLLWPGTRRLVHFCRVPIKDVLKHGRGTLILFFPVLIMCIYRSMDKIMLGNIATMADVALYTNADKIIDIPFGMITALGVVMIPRMTSLISSGNIQRTYRYIEVSMRFIMFLACGMAFGLMGVGRVFAPVFFGEEFIAAGPIIMIIAPVVIVRACANIVGTQYLLPHHRDRDYIVSILIGVLINLGLNAVLIPRWQSAGAAIATLAAEISVAFYQIYICRKEIPVANYFIRNWVFIAAGIVMFFPVYYFGKTHPVSVATLIIQIAIGLVIYLIIGGGYLYKCEHELVKKVLKGKKNNIS